MISARIILLAVSMTVVFSCVAQLVAMRGTS